MQRATELYEDRAALGLRQPGEATDEAGRSACVSERGGRGERARPTPDWLAFVGGRRATHGESVSSALPIVSLKLLPLQSESTMVMVCASSRAPCIVQICGWRSCLWMWISSRIQPSCSAVRSALRTTLAATSVRCGPNFPSHTLAVAPSPNSSLERTSPCPSLLGGRGRREAGGLVRPYAAANSARLFAASFFTLSSTRAAAMRRSEAASCAAALPLLSMAFVRASRRRLRC